MKKNIYFAILIIIIVVLGIYVGILRKNSETIPSTSSIPVVDVGEPATSSLTALELRFEMDKKEKGTQLYYSEALGVGFTHKLFTDDYVPQITESGNKIYVGEYQSIEVFTKDAKLTLEQAVRDRFLRNIDPKKCFTTQGYDPKFKNYVTTEISFPRVSNDPGFEQFHICPLAYSDTSGVQYFLMNKDVSTKFLFVEIGQDSLMYDGMPPIKDERGENGWRGWNYSIQILR